MRIEVWRDYVIVIAGILQIILILGFSVLMLVLYFKINSVIKKGRQTVFNVEKNIESTLASPYFKAGSWIFGWLAELRKNKEEKER